MKRVAIACIILLLIGIGAVWVIYDATFKTTPEESTSSPVAVSAKSYTYPTRASLIQGINAERAKAGIAPMTETPSLDTAAQMKADDMVKRHYDTHTLPGSDQILTPEMREQDYQNCQLISENLYWGREANSTTEAAVDGWMHSTAHRNAILNPRYTQTGFGIAGKSTVTIVEHFCIAK